LKSAFLFGTGLEGNRFLAYKIGRRIVHKVCFVKQKALWADLQQASPVPEWEGIDWRFLVVDPGATT
jgi:hypothetical protein